MTVVPLGRRIKACRNRHSQPVPVSLCLRMDPRCSLCPWVACGEALMGAKTGLRTKLFQGSGMMSQCPEMACYWWLLSSMDTCGKAVMVGIPGQKMTIWAPNSGLVWHCQLMPPRLSQLKFTASFGAAWMLVLLGQRIRALATRTGLVWRCLMMVPGSPQLSRTAIFGPV